MDKDEIIRDYSDKLLTMRQEHDRLLLRLGTLAAMAEARASDWMARAALNRDASAEARAAELRSFAVEIREFVQAHALVS